MERNQETIAQLQENVSKAIQNDPMVRDMEKFNLKDITIDSTMSIGNKEFSEKSIKKVLDVLNVKPNFTDYRKSMSEADWKLVADRIKDAKGDLFLYGELGSGEVINNIHYANPKKKKSDDMTNSLAVINAIENELRTSENEFSLARFNFDSEKYTFDIELKNESSEFDALAGDSWKVGNKFTFNSTNFKYLPYFERLVCSNGMIGKTFGFNSNISKASFNNEKIEKIINNALASFNPAHTQLIESHANYLKGVNISLAEFYGWRNWFNKGPRKDAYKDIMDKYFPEAPFYKAFSLPVAEQTTAWKRTADAGINAYDFFNLLTWIASHPTESMIESSDAIDLKIASSSFFFWDKFDMLEIAPKVKVDYPRLIEMN